MLPYFYSTVSNELLLLANYYIDYSIPYYMFSVKQVDTLYDFQRLTTRYHQIFLKKAILEKLIVTRSNALENWH